MEKVFFDSGEQIKTSLDRFRIIFNFNDWFVFATTSLVIDILRQMAFAAKTLFLYTFFFSGTSEGIRTSDLRIMSRVFYHCGLTKSGAPER